MNIAIRSRLIETLLILLPSAEVSAQVTATKPELRLCQVITTGGTIAMKIDPAKNAPVPALSGEDLIAGVPELTKVAKVRVESPFNIGSTYMNPARWVALQKSVARALASEEVAGVVITHGTDTMEETAYFLDLTIANEKPVILVGAQRNASERDSGRAAQPAQRGPALRLPGGTGAGHYDRDERPS